jgi:hypothetical protein
MIRNWVAGTWALAFCFLSTMPVEARTIEERDVGDWQLVALADDSGTPKTCYVLGASVSDGQLMTVMIDDKREWYLVVHNEKWELSDGARRDLTYAIDGGAPVAATADALGPKILRVALGVSFDATEPLRRGNRIEIRFEQGGRASFSLKGSSNALDALLACATRHLNYQDDPDIARIGSWLVLRKPHEDGSCRAAIAGDHDALFIFAFEEESGYYLRISHRNDQWHLHEGEKYVLTYRIDEGAPVEIYAGASSNTVLIPLDKDAASLQPFKNGRRLHMKAQRQYLTVDLADAAKALDALEMCAKGIMAQADVIADPFSSAPDDASKGSSASSAASSGPLEEVMPSIFPPMSGQKDRLFIPEPIGAWSILASDKFGGFSECSIFSPSKAGDPRMLVVLDRDLKSRVTFFETGMHIEDRKRFTLRATVDASEPVIVTGKSLSRGMIDVEPDEAPSFIAALRRGGHAEFEAEGDRFALDLTGAAPAFSALEHCTAKLTAESPAPDDPLKNLSFAPTPDDPEIDRAITNAQQLRLTQVVFTHDAEAKERLRGRLRVALRNTPDAEKTAKATGEVRAFLATYVEAALKTAPGDALAKMARHDREVMQQLRSQPDVCAAFFKANGDLGFLPPDMRAAQGEIYADLIEASFKRPAASGDLATDEQVVTWMAQAYADAGYPAEDITRLAEIATLGPTEVCRLGNEYMVAVTSLNEAQIGRLYRTMSIAEP